MNKIINLINFIKVRILVIIILLIQLTITLFTYANYLYIKDYSTDYVKSINQQIPLKNSFTLKLSYSESGPDSLNKYDVRKQFIDYIESLKNVQMFIHTLDEPSSSKVRAGYDTEILQGVKAEMASNLLFLYQLNQSKYNYTKQSLKLDSGDYLSDPSTEDVIPVLAGFKFKKLYTLGEIIDTPSVKLKIIGFLKSGEFVIDENLSKIDLDDSLISNNLNLNDKTILANSFGHINIIINDSNFDNYITLINKKAQELGIDVYLVSSNNIMDDLVASFEKDIQSLKIKTYFYLILSICGLTGILFYSILDRKKEFGILLSQGASWRNIISLVVSEQFLILIIAFILTLIFSKLNLLKIISNYNDISLTYYFKSLLLEILILLIASIPPIVKILTLSPRELIGGLRE